MLRLFATGGVVALTAGLAIFKVLALTQAMYIGAVVGLLLAAGILVHRRASREGFKYLMAAAILTFLMAAGYVDLPFAVAIQPAIQLASLVLNVFGFIAGLLGLAISLRKQEDATINPFLTD